MGKIIKSSSRPDIVARRRRIFADDEIGDMDVAPEASDLLFETEDVAELLAEVTGEDIEVTAEDTAVTFSVGDDDYTVEAEGDEEIVESSTRFNRSKRRISASRSYSKDQRKGRVIRRYSSSK